jgi:ankyrin repeat protein
MQTDEFLEAVKKSNNEKILQLLESQPSLARTRDPSGVSAIFLALYRGNRQAATAIAERNPSLDIFEAAAIGNITQLKNLVNQAPSLVDSYSPDGFTALALAAYLGQKDSVAFLLAEGADSNALAKNETGFTALTGAVSQNHNQIARVLVEHGANVNHRYEGGFTPLMHATYAGNEELISLLLDNGADPNAKNADGKTALTLAQEKGNEKILNLLQKHSRA